MCTYNHPYDLDCRTLLSSTKSGHAILLHCIRKPSGNHRTELTGLFITVVVRLSDIAEGRNPASPSCAIALVSQRDVSESCEVTCDTPPETLWWQPKAQLENVHAFALVAPRMWVSGFF